MASKSSISYAKRAQSHPNALAVKLFRIAESKKSSLVVLADLTTTKALLELADSIFLTHRNPTPALMERS